MEKLYWFHGIRLIAITMFVFSAFDKLVKPTAFYTIVNSLNLHIHAPEIFLSIMVTVEVVMIYLLIFNPNKGVLISAWVLILFTVLIGGLYAIGIRELCQDEDVLIKYLGPATVLQNIGLSFLLFSSWMFRKESSSNSDSEDYLIKRLF